MGKKNDDKQKRKFFDVPSICSYGCAIIGAVATIYAAHITDGEHFFFLFVNCIACEVIVVILYGWILIERIRNKNRETTLEDEATECKNTLQNELEKYDKIYEEKHKNLDKDRKLVEKQLNSISVAIKNNSIHSNELVVKIPSEGDESYYFSDLIINSDSISMEDKKKKLIEDANRYANALFELYKNYCALMLGEITKLETAYVGIRGFDLKISTSIKLFDRPYVHDIDIPGGIKIYTAFRDKETYENKDDDGSPKREIGKIPYSIQGNNDFLECLVKEQYVINNAPAHKHYRNEHKDYYKDYNCAVVVPIRIKRSDGKRKFLGYLCCDCLNDKYAADSEIFDNGSAQFLFTFAQNFATFLETLETNWLDRFSDNAIENFPESVSEYIFNKTFHFT